MQRKRILVVDDDESIRTVVAYSLQRIGYTVLICEDAGEALDQIRRERINLVILDLALPQVDGFSILERLGTEIGFKSVAALVLTAYEDEVYRRRCLGLGAKRFIVKPFSPRELAAAVAEIMGAALSESERPAGAPDTSDFKKPPALTTAQRYAVPGAPC